MKIESVRALNSTEFVQILFSEKKLNMFVNHWFDEVMKIRTFSKAEECKNPREDLKLKIETISYMRATLTKNASIHISDYQIFFDTSIFDSIIHYNVEEGNSIWQKMLSRQFGYEYKSHLTNCIKQDYMDAANNEISKIDFGTEEENEQL